MPARVITGHVQHYDWGDGEFIPRLLGVAARGQTWAELWLGTHPSGPSLLEDGSELVELTGELPYLLKVLAAGRPLSLQAHPSREQAEAGHDRGDFDDPNAKPELLVALTRFEALCGFAPVGPSVEHLRALGLDEVADVLDGDGTDAAMRAIYAHDVDVAGATATLEGADDPHARWARRLAETYGSDDPSVLVTMLLNHVVLEPGQALHLTAGNLHAYLGGAGLELMGASDNVVRGGLTSKEVDVELLLEVVDPTPLDEPTIEPTDGRYALPEAGVALVRLEPGDDHRAVGHEMAVTVDGTTLHLSPGTPIHPEHTTYVVTPL
ncbi:mannose-6-phosphate isomerase, class I [Ilumatobacter sp.]|uniref:mannose-6-phosphate isomerase, class I n=1 Tax=Ilumatobacter sp. TaxID=1967498 RepID=UPI003B52A5AA